MLLLTLWIPTRLVGVYETDGSSDGVEEKPDIRHGNKREVVPSGSGIGMGSVQGRVRKGTLRGLALQSCVCVSGCDLLLCMRSRWCSAIWCWDNVGCSFKRAAVRFVWGERE